MGATPPGHSPGSGSNSLLATALYLVAVALIAQGVAQALNVGGIEAPVGSVRWRFGFIGIIFLQIPFPLLGFAIGSLTAAVLRHRAMLGVFAAAQLGLGLAAAGAFLVFLLDAVQIAATVPPSFRGNYDTIVTQTSLVGAGAILLIMMIGLASLSGFRAETSARARSRATVAPPIVGRR